MTAASTAGCGGTRATTRRRACEVAAVCVLVVAAGCGSSEVVGPSDVLRRPDLSRPPDVPPGATPVTITGQVLDDHSSQGVSAARVAVESGALRGLATVTDANGRFTLTGAFESPTQLRISKTGYATTMPVWTCSGSCETTAPLSVAMTMLFVDLSGNYAFTISADPSCTDLPPAARTRSYQATMYLFYGSPDQYYQVQLAGADFQGNSSGPFNWFFASVSGDWRTNAVTLSMEILPPEVIERIPPNSYVSYGGVAAGPVPSNLSTIATTFDGSIEFCSLKSPMRPDYDCTQEKADPTPSQPVSYGRCESKQHRIVLERRGDAGATNLAVPSRRPERRAASSLFNRVR